MRAEAGNGRRRAWLATLAALAGAGLACSGLETGVSYDPMEAFPPTAAWTWHEPGLVLPADPRLAELGLGPILEDAITSELARRGYKRSLRNVRYLVAYQLRVSTRTRPEESISIATLSLLVLEPGSLHTLWSGFARAEVDPARNEAERRHRLAGAVAKLLRDFPPGS